MKIKIKRKLREMSSVGGGAIQGYAGSPLGTKEENEKFKGRHAGPGSIQFNYGEGNKQFVTYRSIFPEVGDMFIFPASLVHWVIPFKSDCVRISVSGNIDKQTEGLI